MKHTLAIIAIAAAIAANAAELVNTVTLSRATNATVAAANAHADSAVAPIAASVSGLASTVSAWQTYWDGDDVRVTITNYYGSADLPHLYIEQRTNEVAMATNLYRVVWDETTRLTPITNAVAANAAAIAALDSTKADRAWGYYDSHTGEWAPDGFTSISSGSILIGKDLSYQKTVTASGSEVWVLMANSPTVITGTGSNGVFRLTDGDGNSVFEVVKGDKRTVPATCSAVTPGNNSLTITYNVVAADHPSIEICDDLTTQQWAAEGDAGCPATVSWSGSSGAWVATVTGIRPMSKMFVKGTYADGGETYVRHSVPVGFDKVLIGGVYYRVAVETVSGKKLMVLTEY